MTVASWTSSDDIAVVDPEILPLGQAKVRRQPETVELIASENYVSRARFETARAEVHSLCEQSPL
jgi:glycine/serine hydroxymethyltransferase